MDKNQKRLAFLATVGAISAYRAYKGKGMFNKIRFKEQHEAVGNYIDTHYPGAFYSAIEKTSEGFRTIVTYQEKKLFLYIIPSQDTFIFEEKELN